MKRTGVVIGLATMLWLLIACGTGSPPPGLERATLAGDWAGVEKAAQDWTERDGFRRVASVLRGYAALARGDAAGAAAHFLRGRVLTERRADLSWAEALAMAHPDRPVAQLLAADSLVRRGDRHAGIAHLDAALVLDPSFDLARLVRATLRALDGERAAALQDVDPLIASRVAAEAFVVRALVRLEEGDLDAAASDLDRALALAPAHAGAYHTRGVLRGRRGDWVGAAHDFREAFRLLPELEEARRNWQVAKAAEERGAVISGHWHLGVFGTGIRAEADLNYARSHARDLMPGRPHSFLYVGIQGNLPLAGMGKAAAQGLPTVVINPRNPQEGILTMDRFIRDSVAQGRNPAIFIDVNKWVPTQLGNAKREAMTLPAELAVHANATFRSEVARTGGVPLSTVAGHSDFTWVGARAGIMGAQRGVPFSNVVLESPRSERLVREAVRLAPSTQFTVVQPVRGDLWTAEAQARGLSLRPNAYRQTIGTLTGIDAPNYRAAIIQNPTRSPLGIPMAHGDPANYDRFSQVSIWRGGTQIARETGALGQIIGRAAMPELVAPAPRTDSRGGILIGAVSLRRASGGRVVFASGDGGGELALIYTLFGGTQESGDGLRVVQRHE